VQHFAATPTAAGWARRHTADVLNGWQAIALVDDAVLIVSELVGNAVRHAALAGELPVSCRLVLKLFTDALVIEVWDPSPGTVVRSGDDNPLSESGRGLGIVEALCGAPPVIFAGVGVGKTVVAILPRPS
jgi:anti-sigma regulatory factor (Ser/Thr protein kinase)